MVEYASPTPNRPASSEWPGIAPPQGIEYRECLRQEMPIHGIGAKLAIIWYPHVAPKRMLMAMKYWRRLGLVSL